MHDDDTNHVTLKCFNTRRSSPSFNNHSLKESIKNVKQQKTTTLLNESPAINKITNVY